MILDYHDDQVTPAQKAKDILHDILLDSDYWTERICSNVDKMTDKQEMAVEAAVARLTDKLIRIVTL